MKRSRFLKLVVAEEIPKVEVEAVEAENSICSLNGQQKSFQLEQKVAMEKKIKYLDREKTGRVREKEQERRRKGIQTERQSRSVCACVCVCVRACGCTCVWVDGCLPTNYSPMLSIVSVAVAKGLHGEERERLKMNRES